MFQVNDRTFVFIFLILNVHKFEVSSRTIDEPNFIGLRRNDILEKMKSDLTEDSEIDQAKEYPHFESKTIFPSTNPQHQKICWEKCDDKNMKNMKDVLLKKAQEPSRRSVLSSSKDEEEEDDTITSTPCDNPQCKEGIRQILEELKSQKTRRGFSFKNLISKASQMDSGKLSSYELIFSEMQ